MYFLTLVCMAILGLGQACSPPDGWYPKSITEKVLDAEVVLYGKITLTYPDPSWPNSAYTAKMEVICTLKGNETKRNVNLTEAGHVPGMCHGSNLTVGQTYIVLLREHIHNNNIRLIVSNSEINNNDNNIAEVVKACGLRPIYPKGVNASNVSPEKTCPMSSPSGSDCLTLDDIVRPTPRTDVKPETPKQGASKADDYEAYEDANKFEKAEDIRDKQKNNSTKGKGGYYETVIVLLFNAILISAMMSSNFSSLLRSKLRFDLSCYC